MSGQWEVVGKGKVKHGGQPVKKLSKSERKKLVEKAPKVEDILPLSHVKTLYTALDLNKESKKAPGKENSAKETDSRKSVKKVQEKKKELPKEKPPPPKSLENAVKLINSEELAQELEIGQARFQDAPLVWLKGLATYLNNKLTVDHNNPTFSGKPVEYPLSLLPGEIKELLKRAVKDAGESVTQPFYEWCLTSMADNMTKGNASVLGYKMILQFLAFQNPTIVVANIPKVTALRNSYQNRQPIGLSLLWALGLGGFKDLSIGIKVWQEVMVPMIELRNYSAYVIGYIKDILAYKPSNKPLSPEQLFAVLDVLFSPKLNLPNNIQRQELGVICSLLKKHILETEPDKGYCSLFSPILGRLQLVNNEVVRKELLNCLVTCLNKDPRSYSVWRQLYLKNLPESALLLGYIHTSWNAGTQPSSLKLLNETLSTFQVTNEELTKSKQKDEGLEECKKICTELHRNMTVTRNFPWKFGCLVLVLGIAFVLSYDIRLHGSFERSCVGLFLRDIGALQYGEHAWAKTKHFSIELFGVLQNLLVHYYALTLKYGKPYFSSIEELSKDVTNQIMLFLDYVKENIPVVTNWIEFYAPGVLDTSRVYLMLAADNLKHVSSALVDMISQYMATICDWIGTNVPMDSLSMENIQKSLSDFWTQALVYGEQTYYWIWQKVETLSKMN